jgi:ADP-heptose:LPS heptosyltransferase
LNDTAEPVSTGEAPGPSEADFPFLTRRSGPQTVTLRRRPEGADLAVFELGRPASRPREILILKLDHRGDFLMALPALEALRRNFAGDRITLVCGPWNAALAASAGIADEVRTYGFFPEDGAKWTGEPVEGLPEFCKAAAGRFDVAIDLRVDEDTRFLLGHVDAAVKAGIGARSRHPYLDLLLPASFERRESDPSIHVGPHRFQSRMPVQTPTHHETNFSNGGGYLVFGPDLMLPAGRFQATWQIDLRAPPPRLFGVRMMLDVARRRGGEIVGSRIVPWRRRDDPAAFSVEFDNPEDGAAHEFRLHVRGRPRRARLRFYGILVERLDRPPAPRFKPAELHISEQLLLLARLVELRTRPLDSVLQGGGAAVAVPIVWRGGAARIVVAPISNSRLRDWGLDKFSRLVELLAGRLDCTIALVGSPEQRDVLAPIADRVGGGRVVNLAGQTDWAQSAAVIREADLVIGNNSGVAHLAAACGTPTLAIYSGSHQPQEWGPRGPQVRALMALVPCSPCGWDKLEQCPHDHRCMKLITPEAVAAEAIEMLAAPREG